MITSWKFLCRCLVLMTLKKINENQATMGNYISKPHWLTRTICLQGTQITKVVFSGSCRTLQQCLFSNKIRCCFSSHTNSTTFAILTLMKLSIGPLTKTTIKLTISKQNKWHIWMKRNVFFFLIFQSKLGWPENFLKTTVGGWSKPNEAIKIVKNLQTSNYKQQQIA